ncbi:MAG: site-specific integrase, partial [Candidatus Kapaibacterium sp.]
SQITRSDVAAIHGGITRQIKTTKKTKPGHPPKYKSGGTANRILALVSSIFGWGFTAGLCEVNPARGIKKNPERSRDRFIQSDELPRFFKSLEAEENTTIRDYVLMSLLTGARRENVMSMRWDQISFERKEWRIPRTKNDEPQTVPLGEETIQVLNGRKDNVSDFVFPGPGKKGYMAESRRGWKRILQRADIQDLRIHDLRRTLGSWQAKTGASLVIIGKSLNHKSLTATQIYSRLDLDPVRQSVERATSAMLEAAGIKKLAQPHQSARS